MKRLNSTKRAQESGFVLAGVLVIVLFLSIMLAASQMRSELQLKTSIQRVQIQQAFYAAESGIERAVFQIRRDPDWDPQGAGDSFERVPLRETIDEDSSPIGFYSITVSDEEMFNGWDSRRIRSIGLDALEEVTRIIEARVIIENPSRFLFASLGDLRIISGSDIEGDILSQDLYFDVNESLQPPQQDITVDGNVYYIRSINGDTHEAVTILGEVRELPSITFAGVDMDRYRNEAISRQGSGEGIYDDSAGGLQINLSDYSQGSGPIIIFAENDIMIAGEYASSLLVVSGGDILITDDIKPLDPQDDRPRAQIGLFSHQDVIIPEGALSAGSDLALEAFIIADGSTAQADGAFLAEGPKSVLGTLNFTGAISVRGEGRTGIDLNAFAERNYVFNPDLNENRSIPFSPFIVNIIEWSDVSFDGSI